MDYNKLPTILKRYSFEAKVNICQIHSRKIMDFNGIKIEKIVDNIAPWELETFLLFSVKADEYQQKNFDGKNINEFIKMINCIKDYQHPKLVKRTDITFADLIMMVLGLTQFDLQEYNIYKYYRYNWFFGYKTKDFNLEKVFIDYFGCEYQQFLFLGFLLNLLFSTNNIIPSAIIEFHIKKYGLAFLKLVLSRDSLIKEIDKFTSKAEDYLYCVRPFYMYPFIEEKQYVYLPIPHCIIRATTSSLLYRLTDNNNSLREKLGKYVIEKYLYEIVNESNLFDEVIEEQEYTVRKNKLRTLDVMCRKGSKYLFLDSKSLTPYSKLRLLDINFMDKEIKKIAEYLVQVYKHLIEKFNVDYNFFKTQENDISTDNIWGLVVILEDSFIRRELLYEKAREMLSIKKDSNDYNWLINHIKIVSLYDIERLVFVEEDIINRLEEQEKEKMPYNYTLIGKLNKTTLKSLKVLDFKKKLKNEIQITANELKKAKIVS